MPNKSCVNCNYDLTEITRLLMKMRDKCVRKEGEAYDDPERKEKYEALNAAIDLINNPSMLQKWISVKERLPSGFDYFDDGTAEPAEYIVKVKNAEVATIAMFDGKEWIPAQYNGIIEDRWFASSVTHWMPLPEPPKEATTDD